MPRTSPLFSCRSLFHRLGVGCPGWCVCAAIGLLLVARSAQADATFQTPPFSQDWSSTSLITSSDNWSAVPGIMGYRGDLLTGMTGVNPQTVLGNDIPGVVDVNANQTNPVTFITGGVTEFELPDPVVALMGSGTAAAPYLVIHINATGKVAIVVSYSLRDLEGVPGTDDSVQPVALQFRTGASGVWTNVPAGYVADATVGPGLTQVTPVSATLPAAANGAATLQVRIITTNAVGSDEWVGVDDISVTALSSGAIFSDIDAGLSGLSNASVAWGDYDADDDLDIAVVGTTIVGPMARIYRNTGGVFADALALPANAASSRGALAWGDYDRDGDLDLAIAGDTGAGIVTRIFRNTGGSFTDIAAGLVGVLDGALSWGDFDNDGDLDLAVAGSTGTSTSSPKVARVYRNTAGIFEDAIAGITGVQGASMAWVDYDLDGDLDLVVGGLTAALEIVTTLYMNTGGTLGPVASGLPGVYDGSLDWGDYDNDGDSDLLISGGLACSIWRNTAGNFVNAGTVLQGVSRSTAVWGDYDNDGRPDLAEAGGTGSTGFGAVYHNNVGAFIDISAGLPSLSIAALAWGDFDQDGDLDVMAAGPEGQSSFEIHRIYRLSGVSANAPPTAPGNLSVTTDATHVTFHWSAATDAQGAPLGLSYNLWAGTAAGTASVMSPMSNLASGLRRVVQMGNVGQRLQWSIARSAFAGGPVYWGVQAIDQGFAGSAFATGSPVLLEVADLPAVPRLMLSFKGANPARSDSRLAYTIPRDSRVDLAILDITGRRVQTLVIGDRSAGEHEALWNGRTADGSRAAPGLYFARLRADDVSVALRVLRID